MDLDPIILSNFQNSVEAMRSLSDEVMLILERISNRIDSMDQHLSKDWRKASSPTRSLESTDVEAIPPILEYAILENNESPKPVSIDGDDEIVDGEEMVQEQVSLLMDLRESSISSNQIQILDNPELPKHISVDADESEIIQLLSSVAKENSISPNWVQIPAAVSREVLDLHSTRGVQGNVEELRGKLHHPKFLIIPVSNGMFMNNQVEEQDFILQITNIKSSMSLEFMVKIDVPIAWFVHFFKCRATALLNESIHSVFFNVSPGTEMSSIRREGSHSSSVPERLYPHVHGEPVHYASRRFMQEVVYYGTAMCQIIWQSPELCVDCNGYHFLGNYTCEQFRRTDLRHYSMQRVVGGSCVRALQLWLMIGCSIQNDGFMCACATSYSCNQTWCSSKLVYAICWEREDEQLRWWRLLQSVNDYYGSDIVDFVMTTSEWWLTCYLKRFEFSQLTWACCRIRIILVDSSSGKNIYMFDGGTGSLSFNYRNYHNTYNNAFKQGYSTLYATIQVYRCGNQVLDGFISVHSSVKTQHEWGLLLYQIGVSQHGTQVWEYSMDKSNLDVSQHDGLSKSVILLEYCPYNIGGSSIWSHKGEEKITVKFVINTKVVLLHIVLSYAFIFSGNLVLGLESGKIDWRVRDAAEHQSFTAVLWEPGRSIQGWKFEKFRGCSYPEHGTRTVKVDKERTAIVYGKYLSRFVWEVGPSVCAIAMSNLTDLESLRYKYKQLYEIDLRNATSANFLWVMVWGMSFNTYYGYTDVTNTLMRIHKEKLFTADLLHLPMLNDSLPNFVATIFTLISVFYSAVCLWSIAWSRGSLLIQYHFEWNSNNMDPIQIANEWMVLQSLLVLVVGPFSLGQSSLLWRVPSIVWASNAKWSSYGTVMYVLWMVTVKSLQLGALVYRLNHNVASPARLQSIRRCPSESHCVSSGTVPCFIIEGKTIVYPLQSRWCYDPGIVADLPLLDLWKIAWTVIANWQAFVWPIALIIGSYCIFYYSSLNSDSKDSLLHTHSIFWAASPSDDPMKLSQGTVLCDYILTTLCLPISLWIASCYMESLRMLDIQCFDPGVAVLGMRTDYGRPFRCGSRYVSTLHICGDTVSMTGFLDGNLVTVSMSSDVEYLLLHFNYPTHTSPASFQGQLWAEEVSLRSIGYSPSFYILLALHCKVCMMSLPSFFIRKRSDTFALIRDHLLQAQVRTTFYVDKHRSEREFPVGNMFFLRLHPYCQFTVALRCNLKRAPVIHGPFPILSHVGSVVYKMSLLESVRIHNIFHVSQLNKVLVQHTQALDNIPTSDSGGQLLVTADIPCFRIMTRSQTQVSQALVIWTTGVAQDQSRVHNSLMATYFPSTYLEDKVLSQ